MKDIGPPLRKNADRCSGVLTCAHTPFQEIPAFCLLSTPSIAILRESQVKFFYRTPGSVEGGLCYLCIPAVPRPGPAQRRHSVLSDWLQCKKDVPFWCRM